MRFQSAGSLGHLVAPLPSCWPQPAFESWAGNYTAGCADGKGKLDEHACLSSIRMCWAPVYVPDGDGHAMNNRWSTVQCGAQHEVHYTWCMSLATVVLQGFFASAALQHCQLGVRAPPS